MACRPGAPLPEPGWVATLAALAASSRDASGKAAAAMTAAPPARKFRRDVSADSGCCPFIVPSSVLREIVRAHDAESRLLRDASSRLKFGAVDARANHRKEVFSSDPARSGLTPSRPETACRSHRPTPEYRPIPS